MSRIYIATHFVGNVPFNYSHLYLVYDPDNNPNNKNEYVIRGTPEDLNVADFLLGEEEFGRLFVEVGEDIDASRDDLQGKTPAQRFYTALDISGFRAENLWSFILAHADAIADAELTYTLDHDGLNVTGALNSNSVVASILYAVGLSPSQRDNALPHDPNGIWPGYENNLSTLVTPPTDGYNWDGSRYKLGTGGDDTLTAISSAYDYVLDGGNGNDTITGNEGDDAIWGGRGSDTLTGGIGSDVLNGGDGIDTAIFSGDYEDYSIVGNGTVVTDNVGTDGVDTLFQVEKLQFANGVYERGVFRLTSLKAPVADDDTVQTGMNTNVNIHVLGNDYDPDNQVMTLALGTQAAHGTATLNMNGTFTYSPDSSFTGLDSFTYTLTDTDSQATTATVYVAVGSGALIGTSGNDGSLDGDSGANVIMGLAGDDTIDGNSGSDQIYGGDGNDILIGGAGSDTLNGGAGNDAFYGNDGTEQYYGGSGFDSFFFDMTSDTGFAGINENDVGGSDRIYLDNTTSGDRIEFYYASGQLNGYFFSSAVGGADFTFAIDSAKALAGTGVEYIVIDDKAYSTKNIIAAADAESGNIFTFDITTYEVSGYPALLPESAGGPIQPIQAADGGGVNMYGDYSASASTYFLTYADETFHSIIFTGEDAPEPEDAETGIPALGFIKTFNLHPGFTADNIRLTVDNSDNATISIHLDDVGVTYSYAYFENGFEITGYSVSSGSYSDIGKVVGSQSGSVTIYGEDVQFDAPSTETYLFERITFANGDSINLLGILDFEGTEANDSLYGIDRADIIHGYAGADAIYSHDGDDTLVGGVDDDTLLGGMGDDVYEFVAGDGTDTITESLAEGNDTISINGEIADYRLYTTVGGGLVIQHRSTGTDTITAYAATTGSGVYESVIGTYIEQITFEDATIDLTVGLSIEGDSANDNLYGTALGDIILGVAGADAIYGNAGDDTIIGGANDDGLIGGLGDDIFEFAAGDGTDTITESLGEGIDTIRINGDIADYRLYTTVGGGLVIQHRSTGTDTITAYAATTGSGVYESVIGTYIEQITFEDATIDLTAGLSIEGDSANDNLYGTALGDIILGAAGADAIYGNAGDDMIIGGANDDGLIGGLGDDIFEFAAGDGTDTITESLGEGTDTIRINGDIADYRLYTTVGGGLVIQHRSTSTDTITAYAATTGSGVYESVIGTYVEQVIFDDATIDLMAGLSIEGDSANDSLYGTALGDIIVGVGGADALYGNAGNDVLFGGAGSDSLDGGDGVDTASYSGATGAVVASLTSASAGADGDGSSDTFTSIENLIGSAYGDSLTGDGSANIIEGGAGNDTINGAGGNDTVSYLSAGSAVTVNLATTTSQNTVGAGSDTITNTENLTGSSFNDTLTGSTAANVIIGGAGNDTISAGDGNDTVEGGSGDDSLTGGNNTDTVTYANATAAVTVSLANGSAQNTGGAGTDTLATFENLTGSAYNDTLTGDSSANTIAGGDGDDTVEGGAGNDTLTGGNGTDKVAFTNAGSAITFNLSTTSSQNTVGAGSDTVSGFENLTGSAYNDTLTGSSSANVIEGGSGNDTISAGDGDDTLEGGAGDDSLTGGNGTDTATYAGAGSAVTVTLASGSAQNTVGAGTDTLATIENLTGSAYNDTLTGSTSANVIVGGAGNDTISAGDGNDTLNGGAGDDSLTGGNGTDTVTYADAASAVTVSLANGSAQNTVGAGTDTLATIENLTGSAYNDTLTGDSSANTILGGDGNDTIEGGAGNDTLTGGNGTDTVNYANAGSAVTFNLSTTSSQSTSGAGTDTVSGFENLTGSAYNDTLTGDGNANVIVGGAGNDTISGGAGDDVLYGGAGLDAFTGGDGADVFVFEAASAYSNIDTISDFDLDEGDALDLISLLSGFDPLTDAITDWVQFVDSGGNSALSIDRDGTASTYSFTQVSTITGVTGLTDEATLVATQHLLVA